MSHQTPPETLQLHITALSHAAEGIGKLDGKTVFVPFALPGETVRVEIIEDKKKFARARLLEVLTPSPERVSPACPHHFSLQSPIASLPCGGCQLQHLAYPAQLAFKQQVVRDQLTRVAGLADPAVRPILAAPTPLYYRNHVQFALTPAGQLSFRAAGSREIVPITTCLLPEPDLVALLPHIHIEPGEMPALDYLTLRAGDEPLVVFETSADEAPEIELDLPVSAAFLRPDGTGLPIAGAAALTLTVRGRSFQVSAGSFFQVNTAQVETLLDQVLAGLALRGGETVWELYCGVGLFTAFIAPQVARVIGVEAFGPAVADAAINLDEFTNIEIYEAPAEEVLPHLEIHPDVVLLDPPRAGCAPAVLATLAECGATRIVYVSCDPATLARDAKELGAHGYQLAWAQPVDLFPQTHHVECVAVFVK